jgi:tetratricopeptide (TPR) repeat protein
MMLRSWLNFRIKYLVRLANAARDARRWERAVQLYRKALDFAPQDARIWVQYGHALKEAGDLKDPVLLGKSELAYRRAITIAPTMGDTHLQLGHVLKLQGRMEVAVSAYCLAAVLDPATPYHRELAGAGWSDVQLAELARLGTHASLDGGPPATGEKWGRPTRWFFVGDTLEWIDAHDHLTGVGRVTAELLLASFQLSEDIVVPCTTGDSTSGLERILRRLNQRGFSRLGR